MQSVLQGIDHSRKKPKGKDLPAMGMPGKLQIKAASALIADFRAMLEQEREEPIFRRGEEQRFIDGRSASGIIDTNDVQDAPGSNRLPPQYPEPGPLDGFQSLCQPGVVFVMPVTAYFPNGGWSRRHSS